MKLKKAIQDFIEHSKTKGRKTPATLKTYRLQLLQFYRFADNIKPEEITLDLIDAYQKKMAKEGATASTQSHHLTVIKVFLKYLKIRRNLNVLDFQKIELPKVTKKIGEILTDKEIDRLLKATVPNTEMRSRQRAILEILVCSGIRVGELCSLLASDVDFKAKRFKVRGKGGKERICFLTNEAVHYLKKYLRLRKHNSDYLISTYARRHDTLGKPTDPRSIQRAVKLCAERAGLHQKRVYPHMLRRSFGARMLRNQVDLRYIKDFLGHSNIQTTTLYTKVGEPELEKQFKRANTNAIRSVPDGEKKNEFVVMSTDNFYKLTGMIAKNRSILMAICRKFEIKL